MQINYNEDSEASTKKLEQCWHSTSKIPRRRPNYTWMPTQERRRSIDLQTLPNLPSTHAGSKNHSNTWLPNVLEYRQKIAEDTRRFWRLFQHYRKICEYFRNSTFSRCFRNQFMAKSSKWLNGLLPVFVCRYHISLQRKVYVFEDWTVLTLNEVLISN